MRAKRLLGAIGGGAIVIASCQEPTQILIEARTNLVYRGGLVTSFTVGRPGETEGSEPTTESREPWGADGFVGSLTAVPGSADDARLSVKLVLGVDRDARSCKPPDFKGCIVARRSLRYTPNERLRLPIALYAQCKDVACDTNSTCNVLGQCVAAEVDPETCSTDSGCLVPGDPGAGQPPPPSDGGASNTTDGPTMIDAPLGDAGNDAPADALADAAASIELVDCKGASCKIDAGETCCFDSDAQAGTCIAAGMLCPPNATRFTVKCDGIEDCRGAACCASVGSVTCGSDAGCGPYATVCHSTGTCSTGSCTGKFGQYYRTCQ